MASVPSAQVSHALGSDPATGQGADSGDACSSLREPTRPSRRAGRTPSNWRWTHTALLPGLAAAAATVMYAPSIRAPFVSDDYSFLWVARRTNGREFVRTLAGDSDVPWATASYSWRPISFVAFLVMNGAFGDHAWPYHVVMLAGHVTSVLLVWAIARHLAPGRLAPAGAAGLFAIQPLVFQSVTWIASVSSLGLPLALAAWLLLLRAQPGTVPPRVVATSTIAFAVALGMRETCAVFIPAIVGVELVRSLRAGRGATRVLRALSPLVVVGALVATISTVVINDRFVGFEQDAGETLGFVWRHLERALVPAESGGYWLGLVQSVVAIALILAPLATVAARWWIPSILLVTFHVSVVVHALRFWGGQPRYFYFPSVLLVVALATILGKLAIVPASAALRSRARGVAMTVLAVAVVAGTVDGFSRVRRWTDDEPAEYQQVVDTLETLRPEVPDGSTVVVANLPDSIAFFDAYNLRFINDYVWPGRDIDLLTVPIDAIERARLVLGDRGRLVVIDPSQGQCATRRSSGVPGVPAFMFTVDVNPERAAASDVPLVVFGPFEGNLNGTLYAETDGDGAVRLRVDIPWVDPQASAWIRGAAASHLEVGVIANYLTGFHEIFVNGEQQMVVPVDHVDSTSGAVGPVGLSAAALDSLPSGVAVAPIVMSPCRPDDS
jgi:hypothetical protein